MQITVNGKLHAVDAEPDTPLLWVLRDHLKMTGTKYGCGAGLCGACTVIIDGEATRSCQLEIGDIANRDVRTIESLGPAEYETGARNLIVNAWIAEQVPQCGYCQSGQIMAATALLEANNTPSDEEIDEAMAGNICRCGTYNRIRKAIKRAGKQLRQQAAG
ncbi:MAG: (2Fe-2S)-binding protein [Hyphomicrobiales bacterium]